MEVSLKHRWMRQRKAEDRGEGEGQGAVSGRGSAVFQK